MPLTVTPPTQSHGSRLPIGTTAPTKLSGPLTIRLPCRPCSLWVPAPCTARPLKHTRKHMHALTHTPSSSHGKPDHRVPQERYLHLQKASSATNGKALPRQARPCSLGCLHTSSSGLASPTPTVSLLQPGIENINRPSKPKRGPCKMLVSNATSEPVFIHQARAIIAGFLGSLCWRPGGYWREGGARAAMTALRQTHPSVSSKRPHQPSAVDSWLLPPARLLGLPPVRWALMLQEVSVR